MAQADDRAGVLQQPRVLVEVDVGLVGERDRRSFRQRDGDLVEDEEAARAIPS